MEVAVFVHCHGFVLAAAEIGYGLACRVEVTDLHAVLGNHADEYDVMSGSHGMSDGADLYTKGAVADSLKRGKVLLSGSIDGVGNQLLHGSAAAYGGNSAVDKFDDNISAAGADVEFNLHSIEF